MGLEYVDIFYSHRPDPETPVEETMSALDQAVRSGKALYAGISNYNAEQTDRGRRDFARARHALPDSSAEIFDVRAMPERACSMCSGKKASAELLSVRWRRDCLPTVISRHSRRLPRLEAARIPENEQTLTSTRLAQVREFESKSHANADNRWPRWRWRGYCATAA